jgi:hypothetical protein
VIFSSERSRPTEDKSDDAEGSFMSKEIEIDHFPEYHLKIILSDFNSKVGRGDIFKPRFGSAS